MFNVSATFFDRERGNAEGWNWGVSDTFLGERGEIISQLIEGQYPRYEDVIPKDNDKKIEVKREELITVVRMASFMTSEGYHVVKFIFKDGKLMLQSKAQK